MLKVLILGGTRFLGRHMADAFRFAGHQVTLFNRGITDPSPREGITQVHGDRTVDFSPLDGMQWDAVIDMSTFSPAVVERSARFFDGRTRHYVFTSTISVYDFENAGSSAVDEDAATLGLPAEADPATAGVEYYGALKAICERIVASTFRQRATILRPGLIVGPYDPTDRFTYWPLRIAAGGTVAAPPADARIQYVDARDVANFAVHLVEQQRAGTYNVTSSPGRYTFYDLLSAALRASGSHAAIRWISEDVLKQQQIGAWVEFPLWIPRDDPFYTLLNTSCSRAMVNGFSPRPLLETVRDTLAWAGDNRALRSLGAGLSAAREAELLAAA